MKKKLPWLRYEDARGKHDEAKEALAAGKKSVRARKRARVCVRGCFAVWCCALALPSCALRCHVCTACPLLWLAKLRTHSCCVLTQMHAWHVRHTLAVGG
jgi:hypothetical protein